MNVVPKKYVPLLIIVLLIVGYEWFINARTERYQAMAYLSEGLAISAPVKIQVATYYQMQGEFPDSNAEADLPMPEAFNGQSLVSVGVSDGGIVTLTFDEKSGVSGGIIEFIPIIDFAKGVTWECFSPSYHSVPACRYVIAQSVGAEQ